MCTADDPIGQELDAAIFGCLSLSLALCFHVQSAELSGRRICASSKWISSSTGAFSPFRTHSREPLKFLPNPAKA
eukprot:471105-Amphidinium_carterae.2